MTINHKELRNNLSPGDWSWLLRQTGKEDEEPQKAEYLKVS